MKPLRVPEDVVPVGQFAEAKKWLARAQARLEAIQDFVADVDPASAERLMAR